MTLFTIKLKLKEGAQDIDYDTIDEFLDDNGLQALFDSKLVTGCAVYCGDKRISGLPSMEWKRLVDEVKSHKTTILRPRT